VTDQRSQSSEQLRFRINSYFGHSAAGKFVHGFTDTKEPFTNYIANDADIVLKGAEFFATWVHELGNSLAAITGIDPLKPADAAERYDERTPDAGTAFEDCVFGGKVLPNGAVRPPR
jgi:hypothetical protein